MSHTEMGTHSTQQVARLVGIGRMTLLRWLKLKPDLEPRRIRVGQINARVWNDRDVERIRKYKAAHYRKGRGRKKAQKKSGNR
jgi:predicted DNA-binding transcriptional regulator AlpA